MKKNNKKAFTIVELVIVIGVIGILSAILIPTFTNLTNSAREAARRSDLANVYAEYAADAADGYVGGAEGDASAVKIDEMLAQDKVALRDKKETATTDGYYIYQNNQWSITAYTSTTLPGVAPTATKVLGGKIFEYSGYEVYSYTDVE